MSLSRLGHDMLRKSTELQMAVYRYLGFDAGDSDGILNIQARVKEIQALMRKLIKEDADD